MSDIDKILRDKLNQEDEFPRMNENWERLSQNMQKPPAPTINWWRWSAAATVLLLIGSNLWAWMEMKRMQNTLSDIQSKNVRVDTISQNQIVYQKDTIYKNIYLTQKTDNQIVINKNNLKKSENNNLYFNNTPDLSRQDPSVSNNIFNKNQDLNTNNIVIKKDEKPIDNIRKDIKNNITDDKNDVKTAETPIENKNNIENKNTLDIPKKDTANQAIVKEEIKTNMPIEEQKNTIQPKENPKDTAQLANIEVAPQELEGVSKPKIDTALVVKKEDKIADIKQDLDEDLALKPIIKPSKWQPQFAVGVNGLMAFTTQKSLAPLYGLGGNIEMSLTERLSVNISAELGEIQYEVKELKRPPHPKWHLPKDPRPNPNFNLHEVEGVQKKSQLGISLNYKLNKGGWVTPFVRLGYAWQRISEQSVKFGFKDIQGGSFKTIEISNAENLKNNWHLGVGVEKQLGNFSLAFSTDYQKDFSNKSLDNWMMRSGLKYNF